MNSKRRLNTILVAAALALATCTATAYINPGFTPVNLVDQADCILLIKPKLNAKGDQIEIEVLNTLKGKDVVPKGPISVSLAASALQEHAAALQKRVKALGDEPALLIIGKGEAQQEISYLHLMGKWYAMAKGEGAAGAFDFDKIDEQMEGTWAGGTDMFVKIIDLLLKRPETPVPVEVGSEWAAPVKVGNITGRVTDSRAVDPDGSGTLHLYVASTDGDRLYAWDAKAGKLGDLTATRKFSAKSTVSAWADINGDGRLDLASWDGQTLSLVAQSADGTFGEARPATGVPQVECLGLVQAGRDAGGRSFLLWSSPQGPVLLKPGEGTAYAAEPLKVKAGAVDLAALGAPGRCLLADFNCDGWADVIFPLARGGVFFPGTGAGAFGEGVACAVALGSQPASGFTGDFDMDGRLDVCCVGQDGIRMWQNRPGAAPGEARFTDYIDLCGEMTYISKPGGLWGNTCDINNDGMQDTFWVYSEEPDIGPHIFFNRGFRSFGHGHAVDITEKDTLGRAEAAGQQHGILADFTGDGAQDMFVVLKNGDAYFFRQDPEDERISVRVCLPPGAPGPVKVTAWEIEGADGKASKDGRCLGAWNVMPGADEAFFGQAAPGELRLSWLLPGSDKPVERKVSIEDTKPIRIVIGK
jgi:hypothetical protein